MSDVNGPVVVRRPPSPQFVKPGIHSHNITRKINRRPAKRGLLTTIRLLLLLIGLCAVGYYAYSLSNQYIYEAYQNWAFDQQISGRGAVTFADYIREKTPFGFLAGAKPVPLPKNPALAAPSAPPTEIPKPVNGSLLGRVEIARLNLSAMVREGVDPKTLSVAVGHVPSTSLPGQPGNFAIAAHRDTLFRALKDIRQGDLVSFQSPAGTYSYQVVATKIVKPSDVSVLRPDGGGLIAMDSNSASAQGDPQKLLTMITCYPFYYVGSAPKRFIVEAKLVPGKDAPNAGPPAATKSETAAVEPAVPPTVTNRVNAGAPSGRRSRFHSRMASRQESQRAGSRAAKKHGFWHKVLHIS